MKERLGRLKTYFRSERSQGLTEFAIIAPGGRVERGKQREDLELRVAALEQDRREVYQGLLEAAHVQRRLSGPRQIQRGRFDIASEVFPVRHLAGDFVSAVDIGARTWIAQADSNR